MKTVKRFKDGTRTRRVGELLCWRLPDCEVYFDHGDSTQKGVCQPTTYMGRRYGDDATLSGVDIVIVYRERVIVLVEVEESCTRPKVILGDVFGIALADRIRISGTTYPIRDATLIVSLAVSAKGKQVAKYMRLERHLNREFAAMESSPIGGRIAKLRIVPGSIDDLVRRTERLVRLEVGKTKRR